MNRPRGNHSPGAGAARTTFGGLSRSRLMSKVRGRGNATTELRMIAVLRAERISGWRRNSRLPGKPDFVWRTQRVALFVDGCFWHGHACGRNLTAKTNASFWRDKIKVNQRRDRRVSRALRALGWKVIRVWECRLTKHPLQCAARIRRALVASRDT